MAVRRQDYIHVRILSTYKLTQHLGPARKNVISVNSLFRIVNIFDHFKTESISDWAKALKVRH